MRSDLRSELLAKLTHYIPFGGPHDSGLTKLVSTLAPLVSTEELPEVIPIVLKAFGSTAGFYYVPQLVRQAVEKILEGRTATIVCDPWAGIGELLAIASVATHATRALAFSSDQPEAGLGRVLFHVAEWHIGEPLNLVSSLKAKPDVVVSMLPLGAKTERAITLEGLDGQTIELRDDLGHLLLAAAAMHLSANGVGLFIVPASFFLTGRSVLRHFNKLGLTVEGTLALPAGSFAPFTNMLTYLVVVKKGAIDRMFVARLSTDANTNSQIISNLREGKEGGTLELGRFIDTQSFRGLAFIRTTERLQAAEQKSGASSVLLGDLATKINLGRHGEGFKFEHHDNAIYVPLIGTAQVADSVDECTLKPQNYAQVIIDPTRSDSKFVARFLNSDIGTEIREASKFGFIPKLNTQTLKGLRILVPDLRTQQTMLEIESRIVAEFFSGTRRE